ncbi:TraX family protein [Clostridium hydrogeniformans]|uniref:TraX family protein n=1 Tax=Clostridium hydrogeniformans TaxID=349933 RepID=UPI000483846F|nr:TraX family protein [Clostridium hydrogeniformans]
MNAFILKIIAMLFMVFDHLASYIGGMPIWFPWVGRVVAPIFMFFLVEGFYHTRDRKKYLLRLFKWAIIMALGSFILNLIVPSSEPINNNIFLSFALGIAMLMSIDYLKKSKNYMVGVPIFILTIVLSFFTEASIFGVISILIFYFFRGNKFKLSIVYIMVSLIITGFFSTILSFDSKEIYNNLFLFDPQWMQIFSLIFILSYNGKRGLNNKFSKYLFYIFYPAHLWIISLLSMFIK